MTVLVVLLAVVVGLLAVLVAGLLRSHAEVLRALHELGLGDVLDPDHRGAAEQEGSFSTRPGVAQPRAIASTEAADLVGATIDGGSSKVTVDGVEHRTLLAFLSSGCLTCAGFWQAFAEGGADQIPGGDTQLVIITKGPEAESLAKVSELAPRRVKTLMSSQAWDDYNVPVSPYFLLVDGPTGSIVGEGAAASWPQVVSLLEQSLADAGLATTPGSRPARSGAERMERADEELERAGIGPGHPSLYLDGRPDETEDQ
ncbi:MAG: hypothetical protein HKN26_01745 [Acidimicrobiales bacterium]|nr:hypothetical protein [Acidimicrobiales bacterium]